MARYIDVEALERMISNEGIEINNSNCKDFQSYINGAKQFKFQAVNAIRRVPAADVIEITEDFETILICAERYACGRRTYMPSTVIKYITPLLPSLSERTLTVIERDIADAGKFGGWGDEYIDKPLWMEFLECVRAEIGKRSLKK